MNIINSKYRVSNGTDFDTFHLETNAGQVKVDINSNKTLNDVIFGERHDNQDLAIFKDKGSYLVSNSTDVPNGTDPTLTYLLEVKTVEDIVIQSFYDHVRGNIYIRSMTSEGFSSWALGSKEIDENFVKISTFIQHLNESTTLLDSKITVLDESVNKVVEKISETVTSHNHDERYVPKKGGVFTGKVEFANGSPVVGKMSNGEVFLLFKAMTDSKSMVIGDNDVSISINSKDIKLNGSKLINETQIKTLAESVVSNGLAKENTYTATQSISKKRLRFLNGVSGQTTSVGYSGGVGNDFTIAVNGVDKVRVNDTSVHVTGGVTLVSTAINMRSTTSDKGVGLSYADTKLSVYDYQKSKGILSVDRATGEVQFTKNSIELGGRKLSIGSTAPTSPTTGDIWIG